MKDKIVELDNGNSYVLLDEKDIEDKKYYFALRLDEKEEPTNNYLFFEETIENRETYLLPVTDEQTKGLLLTSFTINYLDKVYDEV